MAYLSTLPPEVLLEILSCLSGPDLLSLASSSKYFRCLSSSTYFWRKKFLRFQLLPLEEIKEDFAFSFRSFFLSLRSQEVAKDIITKRHRLVRLPLTKAHYRLLLTSSVPEEAFFSIYDLIRKEGRYFQILLEEYRALDILREKTLEEINRLIFLERRISGEMRGEVLLRLEKDPLYILSLTYIRNRKEVYLVEKRTFNISLLEFYNLLYRLYYFGCF